MEATRITQHGKIYLKTPTHAIETQEALQRAGLKHVGKNPSRINQDAIGLHWGDGFYFTTSRSEVYKYYPGPQYDKLEFQAPMQWLDNVREGHRTQKAMRAGLIAEITPLVVESMNEALKRYPKMAKRKKVDTDERRSGWKCFCSELKKRRDKYILAHVRVVLKQEFPHVTQLYDSTFVTYYREVL
jgi:hypothetical protein